MRTSHKIRFLENDESNQVTGREYSTVDARPNGMTNKSAEICIRLVELQVVTLQMGDDDNQGNW